MGLLAVRVMIQFLYGFLPLTEIIINKAGLLIEIFPNPAKTELAIYSKSGANLNYEIYNLQGSVLIQGSLITKFRNNGFEIDVSSLQNGIYILKVFDVVTKTKITKKLILQEFTT